MTDTSNRVVKTALTPHSYTTRDVTIADMLVVLGYDTVYEALEAMCKQRGLWGDVLARTYPENKI